MDIGKREQAQNSDARKENDETQSGQSGILTCTSCLILRLALIGDERRHVCIPVFDDE